MFEFREQCGHVVRNYMLLQGDRVLPYGAFCSLMAVLMAAEHYITWIPVESWSPWSYLAVFLYCFTAFWIFNEQCEANYGRLPGDDKVGKPLTMRGHLILGAILTALLLAGDLLSGSLAAVELVAAAWMVGYLLQGGRLRRCYLVVGAALGGMGMYDTLSALFEWPVLSGSWFMAAAGAVIVIFANSDQSILRESLRSLREEGGYDV